MLFHGVKNGIRASTPNQNANSAFIFARAIILLMRRKFRRVVANAARKANFTRCLGFWRILVILDPQILEILASWSLLRLILDVINIVIFNDVPIHIVHSKPTVDSFGLNSIFYVLRITDNREILSK